MCTIRDDNRIDKRLVSEFFFEKSLCLDNEIIIEVLFD
jgi:hypothetical protein